MIFVPLKETDARVGELERDRRLIWLGAERPCESDPYEPRDEVEDAGHPWLGERIKERFAQVVGLALQVDAAALG
jgi:hypothetical protein